MRTIKTSRLELRAMSSNDCDNLFTILNDADTTWWADLPHYETRYDVQDFIDWGNYRFAGLQYGIYEKDSDKVIGFLQVKEFYSIDRFHERELGYVLSKDYRGRGYMSEAVQTICDRIFADDMIDTISLEVLPANGPSQGVARKCGFVLEPQAEDERELRYLDDQPLDRLVLSREHFAARKAA